MKCLLFSAWLFLSRPCVTTWTTAARTTNLCWTRNRLWPPFIRPRRWNIIISTRPLPFCNRYFCFSAILYFFFNFVFLLDVKHYFKSIDDSLQEGHNIFGKLTSNEYKQVLSLIKHCILATDLAVFFPNKSKLSTLMEEEKFSWSIIEHRMLIQAITMTASDLSAAAKPWEIQKKTVNVIFDEFYQQGDAEREAGRQPIEMMDRNKPNQQAASQVGFLTGICKPCYTLLYRLIPETKPMFDMLLDNLQKWQAIADAVRKDQLTAAKEQ